MSAFERYRDKESRAAMIDYLIAKHDLPNCILPDAIADPYEMAKARLETLDEIGLAYLWSEMKETAQRSRDEVYDPWQR